MMSTIRPKVHCTIFCKILNDVKIRYTFIKNYLYLFYNKLKYHLLVSEILVNGHTL